MADECCCDPSGLAVALLRVFADSPTMGNLGRHSALWGDPPLHRPCVLSPRHLAHNEGPRFRRVNPPVSCPRSPARRSRRGRTKRGSMMSPLCPRETRKIGGGTPCAGVTDQLTLQLLWIGRVSPNPRGYTATDAPAPAFRVPSWCSRRARG